MPDAKTLFQQYGNDVFRLALSYTRSVQEAEDICQSVFLKLLEQDTLLPGREKAWLMQVTANQCRSLLRSHWWKTTVPLDDAVQLAAPEYSALFRQVMALPPKLRVVVYLYYYEGYATAEIAALLQLSQSAVTSRLHRARTQLKSVLEEDLQDETAYSADV